MTAVAKTKILVSHLIRMLALMAIYARHLALPNALVINFIAQETLTLISAPYQRHVRIAQELVRMDKRNALRIVQSIVTILKYNVVEIKMKMVVLEPINALMLNVLMTVKLEILCGAINIVQYIVKQEKHCAAITLILKDAQCLTFVFSPGR